MKKSLSIFLVIVLAFAMLAGCGAKDSSPGTTPPSGGATGDGITKIGLGHITSIKSSKDLGTDQDGNDVLPVGQVDTVIVAAAFDKDGKVVKVTIDNAQTKVNFNKDLTLASNPKDEYKTKAELKEDYGMVKASQIKKEWYQQAEELGKWMIGKTVDEIKGMKVKARDESHPAVPDVPELTSLVTITVQDYLAALEEAYNNAVEVAAGGEKLGLGHNISIAKSAGLGKDAEGKEVLPVAQVDTVMSATLFDKDGKVVATLIDNAQTKVQFDKDGKVTNRDGEFKTKVELKEDYGMKKASSIQKEWYEQIAALCDWMKGKTVDEIKGMKVKAKDDAHPAVPDVPELTSSVTISVENYIAAVAEAFENAK